MAGVRDRRGGRRVRGGGLRPACLVRAPRPAGPRDRLGHRGVDRGPGRRGAGHRPPRRRGLRARAGAAAHAHRGRGTDEPAAAPRRRGRPPAERVPPGSLAAVRIFFPDPWPKRRHHKRRLVQPEFVALAASRLAPGGILHLATDWAHYASQMRAACAGEPLLENTSTSEDGWTVRPAERPETKFERRARSEGRDVRDLVFAGSSPAHLYSLDSHRVGRLSPADPGQSRRVASGNRMTSVVERGHCSVHRRGAAQTMLNRRTRPSVGRVLHPMWGRASTSRRVRTFVDQLYAETARGLPRRRPLAGDPRRDRRHRHVHPHRPGAGVRCPGGLAELRALHRPAVLEGACGFATCATCGQPERRRPRSASPIFASPRGAAASDRRSRSSPRTGPGRPGPRIHNDQLVRYAGYRMPSGEMCGDGRHADFTDRGRGRRLGAARAPRPLRRAAADDLRRRGRRNCSRYRRTPSSRSTSCHPTLEWFTELQLRWHAVPAISNMPLRIGGVTYPAAPFNGWYLNTEIGARNLADADRYNLLPVIAASDGPRHQPARARCGRTARWSSWSTAVQHSFDRSGVTMADHHTESERFLLHVEREAEAGRPCAGRLELDRAAVVGRARRRSTTATTTSREPGVTPSFLPPHRDLRQYQRLSCGSPPRSARR